MNRFRIIASLAVAVVAFALASCGYGGSTSPSSSGNANVRFVNGSPDVGGIDVLIGGKVVVTNLTYRQIGTYQSVTVGTNPLPQVAFVKTGTQTNVFPATTGGTAQTFQLGAAPGTNLTIVIEGRANVVGSAGLNLGAFIEPAITNTTGTWSVVFHHASPTAALAAINGLDVGSYTPGTSSFLRLGQVLFSSQTGTQQSFFGLMNQTGITTAPGVGFYAAPTAPTATPSPVSTATGTATPTPQPTVSPSPTPYTPAIVYGQVVPGPASLPPTINGVDPLNLNNLMPFNSDVNLFIYIIDSNFTTSGVELIGTFNN